MTQQGNSSSQNNKRRLPPLKLFSMGDNFNYIKNRHNPKGYSTADHQQKPENPIIIKIENDKSWKKTDSIQLAGIIVAIIVLVVTTCTLKQTARSVDIANRAFINDSSNRITDRASELASDNERHNLDSLGVDAQIKSLREASKQFIVGNEPFLQIEDFTIIELQPGKYPAFTFNIRNLGSYPVKIINSGTFLTYKYNTPKYESIADIKGGEILGVNIFINKDKPAKLSHYAPKNLNQQTLDYIRRIKGFVWFWVFFDYENLVTNVSQ